MMDARNCEKMTSNYGIGRIKALRDGLRQERKRQKEYEINIQERTSLH
jgi:hypothetical protein